ncbi:MAG: viperin family antiviral radical SAM protein [Methanolobus sp.]|jgi:radical S-adenosyl methionine domain-containing protein 2|nr:viperin family antiviral radical SAM protein [Methanolobus sp.]
MTGNKIQSVNWHITGKCNYNCKFCYVQKLNAEIKDIETAYHILHKLRHTKTDQLDIQKINFVGGEPFLHPNFDEILSMAHDMGFVTSIVTNGSFINSSNIAKIAEHADWIGISVDSIDNQVEAELGRGWGKHVTHALEVSELVHDYGMKLKVNTTVTRLTYEEDMHHLIETMDPHRWKIFQMLHIEGQNDSCVNDLSISDQQFESFRIHHQDVRLQSNKKPTFESNDDMIGSYLILDPAGKVLSNSDGKYTPFELDEFLLNPAVVIDSKKYVERDGVYAW